MKIASKGAVDIIKALEANGFEAYIVGGCVRDMLSGRTPQDYDIATNALPDEIKSVFERTVDTGIWHGTVTVLTDGGTFEVTTYRCDGDYRDMRHPESVEFVSDIKEDLSRRDFTVNAMAYNESRGLVDPFGGEADIRNGILKAVGDPSRRFTEDALRIMRLFRFASTLEFEPEQATLNAAKALCKNLESVSAERISSELLKLLCGSAPDPFREIVALGGLESFGIKGDKSLEPITLLPEKSEIRFFAFCRILELDESDIIKKLKLKNSIKRYCEKCKAISFIEASNSDMNIKTALDIAGPGILLDYLDYKSFIEKTDMSDTKKRAKQILEAAQPYKISHLKIKGDDLVSMGYKGSQVGEILRELCDNVKEFPSNNNIRTLKNLANKRNGRK